MRSVQVLLRAKADVLAGAKGYHALSAASREGHSEVLAALLAALPLAGWWAFAILLIYPLQFLRLFMKLTGTPRRRWLSAYAFTVGRFAEFAGQLRYLWDVATGRSARLIEYK